MAKGLGAFERDLDAISNRLKALSDGELDKIIDWTLNSLAHSALKKIRGAPWPIKTKESFNLWQFRRDGLHKYTILNPAVNPYDGKEYVGWVYAKGDKSKFPIADGIVAAAIEKTFFEVDENYTTRLKRYLK
tara:strand:- start:265 stop:660 length:396 start_codon:yes stop_codon:yes gene_type:complete